MKKSQILMIVGSLLLVSLFYFPLWKITLVAPQYPEPLGLNIHIDKLSDGVQFNDVNNIDLLNANEDAIAGSDNEFLFSANLLLDMDPNDPDFYNEFSNRFDVDNMIDYFCLQVYGTNIDFIGNGYANNINKAKTGPKYMNSPNIEKHKYYIMPDLKTKFVDTFETGDIVGGIMITPFTGPRGDIKTVGKWKEGLPELRRKTIRCRKLMRQFEAISNVCVWGGCGVGWRRRGGACVHVWVFACLRVSVCALCFCTVP